MADTSAAWEPVPAVNSVGIGSCQTYQRSGVYLHCVRPFENGFIARWQH